MKTKNEITVWVGRDQGGDFIAARDRERVLPHLDNDCSADADMPTCVCRSRGLALGLHRIVKKGEVARVTFTAKVAKK